MTEADAVVAAMCAIALGGLWVVMKPDTVARELNGRWPLAKKRLCGEQQLEALEQLQQALPGLRVMSGVSLSRMLYVEPRGTAREMRERSSFWAEKKNRASVDFVVCDQVGEILAAVDMLGSSQLRGAGARAQLEKERMLEAAGISVFNLASMSAASIGRAIWSSRMLVNHPTAEAGGLRRASAESPG